MLTSFASASVTVACYLVWVGSHNFNFQYLRLINVSLHDNYNRAYEAGATQNARRLDGGTIQRRPRIERQATARRASLNSGTDDVEVAPLTSKGKTDVPEGHAEMRDLAQSIFKVYFTNDCDDDDIAQLKQSASSKIPSLLKKINGTMAWLPELMNGSDAPNAIKAPILFMEASFRGMAQVRTHTRECGVHMHINKSKTSHTTSSIHLFHLYCVVGLFPEQPPQRTTDSNRDVYPILSCCCPWYHCNRLRQSRWALHGIWWKFLELRPVRVQFIPRWSGHCYIRQCSKLQFCSFGRCSHWLVF